MKKIFTAIILCCLSFLYTSAATPILGTQVATVDRLYEFVKSKNSSFDREIAEQFIAVGQIYGIRGDIALCQSIIETGWFKFNDGTAVTPDQHNYCGLGVTSLGMKGESFATIKEGVTAQIQHLYAYACTKSLPAGETLIDNRFKYVNRGCAPNWEDLGGKWSSVSTYGSQIVAKYNEMMAFQMPGGTNPTPNPSTSSLTASSMSISLSGTKGGTAPSKSITITGTNLPGTIAYNSSSSAFKVSTSNWDSNKGGTMTITLDTSKNAGTYSGYIAVQSGSGDKKVRIEIQCAGTITESTAPSTPTIPALAFTEGWNLSETAGLNANNQWITSVRNFDYADGKLYCIYNNKEIRIMEARSGVYYKNLQVPTSLITGSAYQLCDIKCIDGGIVACNLVYNTSGGELRFYQWANDNATPTLLYSTQVSERAGDCFGIAGSLNGTLRLVTANASGVITEYTRTNGNWSKKTISTGLNTGASTRAIPVNGGYHIDGRGILPTMVNTSGNVLYTLTSSETSKDGNGFDTFTYNGKNYLMTSVYLSNTSTTLDEGAMRLYNVTNGWASGTAVGAYPAKGLGTTRNTNCAGGVITNAGTDYAEAWILTLGQGLAYYKSGNAPKAKDTSGIDNIAANSTAKIIFENNTITVLGKNATSISLVSMTGAIVATCHDNALDISNAESGIYIAIATLDNDKTISKKIAIR